MKRKNRDMKTDTAPPTIERPVATFDDVKKLLERAIRRTEEQTAVEREKLEVDKKLLRAVSEAKQIAAAAEEAHQQRVVEAHAHLIDTAYSGVPHPRFVQVSILTDQRLWPRQWDTLDGTLNKDLKEGDRVVFKPVWHGSIPIRDDGLVEGIVRSANAGRFQPDYNGPWSVARRP